MPVFITNKRISEALCDISDAYGDHPEGGPKAAVACAAVCGAAQMADILTNGITSRKAIRDAAAETQALATLMGTDPSELELTDEQIVDLLKEVLR